MTINLKRESVPRGLANSGVRTDRKLFAFAASAN